MPLKVLTNATLIEERKANAANPREIVAYCGSAQSNLMDTSGSTAWEFGSTAAFKNAEDIADLERLRRIVIKNHSRAELDSILKNAASAPLPADITAFFGRFFMDVDRRAREAPDLTTLIARETINPNFPTPVYKRNLRKWRGIMGRMSGENDKPNMIQQDTGDVTTVDLYIMGLGWKDSLANQLWNLFFSIDKVLEAFTDAYTDYRNSVTVGGIVGATFVASQKQAAIGTSGLTYDEKMYETWLAANKLVRTLLDPLNDRPIAVPSLRILCNSQNTWSIENVIRGQLNGNGSSARVNNRPALPVEMIVEYDRGINDGFTIGLKTASFPGVTAGKAYLYVPGYALVATKRGITFETGMGSVLDFSTEERSAYCVQGEDLGDLLGSSASTPVGGAAGYGAIIEVTLPT